MKGISKRKGFLAAVLIIAMVAAGGVPMTGTSYAATYSSGETGGAAGLEKTARGTGVNEWEINLSVSGRAEGKSSDIVIVMDRSGSMNKNNKLSKAKEAAIDFVYQIRDSVEDAQIAFITFNKFAEERKDFTDLNEENDYENLISTISAIHADYTHEDLYTTRISGTNIQAGLYEAADMLKDSNADLKIILLIGDGEPTYSYPVIGGSAVLTGCAISGGSHTPDWDDSGITYDHNDNKIVGNGYDYLIAGSSPISDICSADPDHVTTHYYPGNHGVPAIYEAKKASADVIDGGYGIDIYSVGIGVVDDGRDVLRRCSSAGYIDIQPSNGTYDFSGIAAAIGAEDAFHSEVTDPIGDNFELIAESGITVSLGIAAYNSDTRTIAWDIGELEPGETATMTYYIKAKAGIIFIEGDGNTHPTNGETTIEYEYPEGGPITAEFGVPKVPLTGGAVTLKAVTVNESGQPITSTGAVTDIGSANVIKQGRFPANQNEFMTYGDCRVSMGAIEGYAYRGYQYLINDGMGESGASYTADIELTPEAGSPIVYFKYLRIEGDEEPYDVTIKYIDKSSGEILDTDTIPGQIVGTTVSTAAIEIANYMLSDGEPAVKSLTVRDPAEDPDINTIIFYYTKIDNGGNGGNGGGGGGGGDVSITTVTPELNRTDHFAYIIGYPDGEVKPLGTITREEVAVIFYRLMTEESRKAFASAEQPFTDVDVRRWSNKEIATLYNAKVIQGNSDGSFQPAKPITRAEFAAIAAKFDKLENVEGNKFADIENHWAEKYINSSAEKGWINGYGDGTFRPDHIIIRCEAMKLINEVLDRRVNIEGLHPDTKHWPDNTPDKWYYEIVLEATNTHDYEREDRPKSIERWIRIKENPVW